VPDVTEETTKADPPNLEPDTAFFAGDWVERLQPPLLAAVALHCGDVGVAEDAVQEALVRLWLRRDRVANPRAWAYRVAFNQATSGFRRRRTERRALDRLTRREGGSPRPEHGVESALDLRAAIARLPDRQRQAVLLRYLADFDLTDVAEVMGCAEGTVKSHLARGLDALRATPGLGSLVELPTLEEDR
jgi:RNA polymerase sigma-70 factor (ECF subfamily)